MDNSHAAVQGLAQGAVLQDVITVQVNDGQGGVTAQEVTITIQGRNDGPVAVNDSATTAEDTGLSVAATATTGLLSNDSDLDGDTLVVQSVGSGQAVAVAGTVIAGSSGGTFTVYPDGSYSFNPGSGFEDLGVGEVRTSGLVYTVSDGQGGTAQAVLTVTVMGTNDAPVLGVDVGSVTEAGVQAGGNVSAPGVSLASGNVLLNDSDVDGDALVVTAVALGGTPGVLGMSLAGTYGSLVLGSDGLWSYALDNSLAATQGLAAGAQATEVFSYTVSDGQGGTAVSTLTVTVTGTNDVPVVSGPAASGAVVEAGGVANGTAGTGEGKWQPDGL